ncbi:MAG: hypothetical protein R3F14_40375 [Polyangiaceae bacterium]
MPPPAAEFVAPRAADHAAYAQVVATLRRGRPCANTEARKAVVPALTQPFLTRPSESPPPST